MIGDAVMSLPFVRSAEAAYEVHVTCAEHSVGIFRMVLPEERIIPWTPPWLEKGGGREKWRRARLPEYLVRLRGVRADVAASVWAGRSLERRGPDFCRPPARLLRTEPSHS